MAANETDRRHLSIGLPVEHIALTIPCAEGQALACVGAVVLEYRLQPASAQSRFANGIAAACRLDSSKWPLACRKST